MSSFASTSFKSWRKLNPHISDHENSPTHEEAFLAWKDLKQRQKAGRLLNQELHYQIRSETDKWRYILKQVLDVIHLLSRQNLPFRGHIGNTDSDNKGNFLEVIELVRCSINSATQNKMPTSLSYHTQNEFIGKKGYKSQCKCHK